jgi:signal transduction histidine kinase
VAIERRIHPDTPLIVGDFSRVVQILYNLLGNSLKFTQVSSLIPAAAFCSTQDPAAYTFLSLVMLLLRACAQPRGRSFSFFAANSQNSYKDNGQRTS